MLEPGVDQRLDTLALHDFIVSRRPGPNQQARGSDSEIQWIQNEGSVIVPTDRPKVSFIHSQDLAGAAPFRNHHHGGIDESETEIVISTHQLMAASKVAWLQVIHLEGSRREALHEVQCGLRAQVS
ncbi:MAG: hypothetical protein AAGC60_00635 [Acidobacteriota bacterium]